MGPMADTGSTIDRRTLLLSGAGATAAAVSGLLASPAAAGTAREAAPRSATNPAPVYRSVSGWGNNIHHPDRGAVGAAFLRRTPVGYPDGVNTPSGVTRPSARVVSNQVCRQVGSALNAQRLTDIAWLWGQFLNHDLNLIPAADPLERFPIEVPADDTAFPPGSVIPLSRSAYDVSTGTSRRNPRQQINGFNSYIDGSSVYGPDEGRMAALRTIQNFGPVAVFGSTLRVSAGLDGPFMPLNTAGLNNQIVGPSPAFFLAGDERANTGVGLMAIHTLLVREHNRLAAHIAGERPAASFEEVYQLARKWVGAILQAITYEEFIPAVLGPAAVGPYAGYDPDADATMSAEFATFGFRFGHSMLSPDLLVVGNDDQVLESVRHGNALLNIGVIQRHGVGPILKGFASQVMQEVDVSVIEDMRSIRFPGSPPLDLVAVDLQRARDHGIPGYNQCRRSFGLKPFRTFAEVTPDPVVREKLASTYSSVDDIDPLIGGLAEPHTTDSTFGPLLRAVMIEQFTRMRAGDRLWYQNDPAFTTAEVDAIQRTRLSDLIKRNTPISNIQDDAFHRPA